MKDEPPPCRFIGAMRLSIKNLARYFRTARGLGTAGVPVFTRSTPERFPSGTMFITFLRSRHDETVEFRPGKSVIV